MHVRLIAVPAALAVGLLSFASGHDPVLHAQAKPAAPAAAPQAKPLEIPPLSYVCIMPGDEGVLEDKPGICPNPKCGMKLVAIRLATAYSSIRHPQFVRGEQFKDPIDGGPTVPIVASMFWTCTGSDEKLLDPGTCPDGKPRQVQYERRAHGDHNPRHGGQFFMADDSWHHLEGTYPSGGPFRVFFYDDFTRPMAVKGFSGKISILDSTEKELAAYPLKSGRATNVLETPIKDAKLPLKVKLSVQFTPTDKMRVFDFTFPEYTKEPVVPPAVTTGAKPAAAPAPVAAAPTPAPAPAAAAAAAPSVGLVPDAAAPAQSLSRSEAEAIIQEMPNNSSELLKLLDVRANEIKSLVDDGNFGMVWVPTMLAKEVALALGDHARELPAQRQGPLMDAVRRLVLSAWRLDQYGDLGDRQKITGAHDIFAAAVNDIKAAYGNR
jgi:hypothetical protein